MKKLYYSIGEVSELTGLEPHVLRYWETVFNELRPKKNRAGNRVYKESDITTILKIKELVQEKKYSTEGAKKILKQGDAAMQEDIPAELKKDLHEIRFFLNNMLDKL
jgi:DNA-binding transcriptional MerR regulator